MGECTCGKLGGPGVHAPSCPYNYMESWEVAPWDEEPWDEEPWEEDA